jgi:hypothetical protein
LDRKPYGLDHLPQGKTGESESEKRRGEQTSYSPIFAATLSWSLSLLIGVIAFKLIRKSLDTDRNFAILFTGTALCIFIGGLCFAYGLVNLLFPILWRHDSNIL